MEIKKIEEEIQETIIKPIEEDVTRIVKQNWDYFQKHDVMSDFSYYVLERLPDNKWKNKILRFMKDKIREKSE